MAMLAPHPLSHTAPEEASLPPLEQGDHLDRETFHARYEAMPHVKKAELVGGMAYMPSPVSQKHGRHHSKVVSWLGFYESATPGVEAYDNATVILSDEDEVQPDACLLINPERGGQTHTHGEYLAGAPELVVEVASTSASYDLHSKLRAYAQAGVREYVVALVREPGVRWYANREGEFEPIAPGEDGLFRSEVFPGLWLDPGALLRLDGAALRATLEQALAAEEHTAFVERLAQAGGGD